MKKWFAFVGILLTFFACKEEVGNRYQEMGLPSFKMDIADATMLALCGPNGQTRAEAGSVGLYKIDADGNMTAVFATTDSTQEIVQLVPEKIISLSADYVLMYRFQIYAEDGTNYGYLGDWNDSYIIRKRDGAMFKIDGTKYPEIADSNLSFYEEEYGIDVKPRMDKNGNVYYLVSSGDVYKFSLNNLSDITMQRITLDQFPIQINSWPFHPYEVNPDGHCIASVSSDAGEKVILYKAEGGMYEFPAKENVFEYFVGYNGDLYCCSEVGNYTNFEYRIFPLNIGTQVEYDFENAISKKTQTAYADYNAHVITLENGYTHVLLSTREEMNNMLVYDSKNDMIKEVGFMPGKMEKVIGISNNSIYRIMDNTIYKYDFVTDEKSTIPIQFDFSTCTVYKDWQAYNVPQGSKFIICAIRNTDLAILRIEIDMETGKAIVFEDMQDRPIISLVQIA